MTCQQLITRSQRLARRNALQAWLEQIEATRLNPNDRCQLLSRIMAAIASGTITASEGRQLSKAVQP